jgi:hypothetical protein
MATRRQIQSAKQNIKKAQAKWKSMTKRQHSLAQPEGRKRKKPGTGGGGKFYHIEIRPKSEFVTFRNQDVGMKGGLERLAGKRRSGSWDTATWLVGKSISHIDKHGHLVVDSPKARSFLKQIKGRIVHVKGDIFKAHPKNVPEKDKPTLAQRRAQRANIKKAQKTRKK